LVKALLFSSCGYSSGSGEITISQQHVAADLDIDAEIGYLKTAAPGAVCANWRCRARARFFSIWGTRGFRCMRFAAGAII
jgi:hypothetical protein